MAFALTMCSAATQKRYYLTLNLRAQHTNFARGGPGCFFAGRRAAPGRRRAPTAAARASRDDANE